jgi:sortase (surface protein transpeptidase)
MSRQYLVAAIVVAILFWMAVPLTPESASNVEASDSHGFSNVVFASGLVEHEFNQPPITDGTSDCVRISRLCDWLSDHGSLFGPFSGHDSSEIVVPDEDEEEVPSTSSSSSSSGENRSVVGWQSATIGSFQQQKAAAPTSLSVPSLSILANVSGVGIDSDRSMQVPDDNNTVGWYRHGPVPGESGSAVIAGHLDDYYGRSVFFDLRHIEIGADILITYEDGSATAFRVFDKQSYDSRNIPSEKIFTRDGEPVLAMITCGGQWDRSAGRYTETVVVYAQPLS